jgi:hypothetical protein
MFHVKQSDNYWQEYVKNSKAIFADLKHKTLVLLPIVE